MHTKVTFLIICKVINFFIIYITFNHLDGGESVTLTQVYIRNLETYNIKDTILFNVSNISTWPTCSPWPCSVILHKLMAPLTIEDQEKTNINTQHCRLLLPPNTPTHYFKSHENIITANCSCSEQFFFCCCLYFWNGSMTLQKTDRASRSTSWTLCHVYITFMTCIRNVSSKCTNKKHSRKDKSQGKTEDLHRQKNSRMFWIPGLNVSGCLCSDLRRLAFRGNVTVL